MNYIHLSILFMFLILKVYYTTIYTRTIVQLGFKTNYTCISLNFYSVFNPYSIILYTRVILNKLLRLCHSPENRAARNLRSTCSTTPKLLLP